MESVVGRHATALKLIRAKAAVITPGTIGTVVREQSQLGRPMLQVQFPAVSSTIMLYPEEVDIE